MDDNTLKQIIRDAASYAADAKDVLRFKLTEDKLAIIKIRLEAARARIDTALEEIVRR